MATYSKIWSGALSDVEEFICDAELDVADVELERDDDHLILESGYFVNVPSVNLHVREGTFCCADEDGDGYSPDFSLTVVCAADGEPSSWLYWEQDGMAVTLANFLRDRGFDLSAVSALPCELFVPAAEAES